MKILKIHKLQPDRSKHYKIISNAPYSSKPFQQYPVPTKQTKHKKSKLLVGTRDLRSKISILKKWKKNNTGIGPVKWNCLVHTNKIVFKKKRKGREKKKTVMKTAAKYFSTQKKKISMLLIFSTSQIFNNSRSEPSDVTGFPFSRRSIWRSKLTCSSAELARTQNPLPKLACVSPPPRPAGTFQARCGSFRDLDRQTHRQGN